MLEIFPLYVKKCLQKEYISLEALDGIFYLKVLVIIDRRQSSPLIILHSGTSSISWNSACSFLQSRQLFEKMHVYTWNCFMTRRFFRMLCSAPYVLRRFVFNHTLGFLFYQAVFDALIGRIFCALNSSKIAP